MITRSSAFIYGRNQPSLGLPGVTVSDHAFFEAAREGEVDILDTPARTATVAARTFEFKLSDMEYNLTVNNGLAESYRKFRTGIWEDSTEGRKVMSNAIVVEGVAGEKVENRGMSHEMEYCQIRHFVWSRSSDSDALSVSFSRGGPSPSGNGAYLSIR